MTTDQPGSPTSPLAEALVEVLGSIQERLDRLATARDDRLDALEQQLAGLEQLLLRDRATERLDQTTAVRAVVAPVAERVEALDLEQRTTAARQNEAIGRIEAAVAAMPGRLTTLEDRMWAVVSSLTEGSGLGAGAGGAPDGVVLARLEEAVDRLARDEASARLVKLVEERLSAGLRAVTERTDEVRRAVDHLAKAAATAPPASFDDDGALDDLVASVRALQSATRAVPDEVTLAIANRLAPLGDRLGGIDDRLDALAEVVAARSPAPPEAPVVVDPSAELADLRRAIDALGERVDASVRREAELLTQRVAALAVGVEASRVLLDQHLRESEATLGRKAGEVTRRLAADFGIRTRRSDPGSRRGDPRELGSGG